MIRLQAIQLGKTFPGVIALQNVSLDVPQGSVIALVGANGAGKSTLIKILTGYYDEYEGQIEIDGQRVVIKTPHDARRFGIGAVYQEVDTALIPSLTVTENLLIDQFAQSSQSILVNWRALHRKAEQILQEIGLQLNVYKRVGELVLHEKQMLLIARAIAQNARYLILDEPTTALSQREIDQLFTFIRQLKQRTGIIYISHRLGEVREIADQIVVLRNGQKVAEFQASDFDTAAVTEAMLGVPLTENFPPKHRGVSRTPVLEVHDLNHRNTLHHINLTAFKGEVLGIAGLVGAGKTELLKALFGADSIDSGEIRLEGQSVRYRTPAAAVRNGIFLVPEERHSQGILIEESVQNNFSLPFLGQFSQLLGVMRRFQERDYARQLIERVNLVPPDPTKKVRDLSGGNQQKVAIGKWFGRVPRVMLFDEPTQGIDVGAKREIYALIRELAQTSAVIYASSDIDEVIGIADRVMVMRDGSIVAELSGETLDRTLLLEYAVGARTAPHQEVTLSGADVL